MDMREKTSTFVSDIRDNGVDGAAIERQRRELAAFVEHSPDAILRYDSRRTHVFVNRMAERYLGLSRSEVEGKRIDELSTPVYAGGEWERTLDSVFETGEPTSFKYSSHTPRGERFFEVRMLPESGADGDFDTVLTVARDVTKQRHHERRLEESEERWRRLVDYNPNAIVIFLDDRLVYGNRAAARFYRFDHPEDLIGRSVYDFFSAEHYTDLHRRLDQLYRGEKVEPSDYKVILADGDERDVQIYSVPITYAGKRAVQSVIRDVTDQREYERNLIEARLRAEEVARLKSAIITNLSHEIRTPLANVLGFNEVLRDHVDEDGMQLLDVVAEGVERLLLTLTTVLDLAQLEGGEIELDVTETDVLGLVRRAVAHAEPGALRKDVEIRVNGGRVNAVIDPVMTYEIVWHLVENAVKFTDEGCIDLTVSADSGDVSIEVRDTGIGISPEFLPRLFDEFEQESKGLGRDFEGNGLGLAIVKRLVNLTGARIAVESTQGEGTAFTVSFPNAVA